MIKSNLAVLMAERGLKMVDVINETGIAKATIRALYYNQGKGVQFETVDTLCEFLGVTPGELFSRIKFHATVLKSEEVKHNIYQGLFRVVLDEETFEETFVVKFSEDKKGVGVRIIVPNKAYDKMLPVPRVNLMMELNLALYSAVVAYQEKMVTEVKIERGSEKDT